jgi:hypothetical protein
MYKHGYTLSQIAKKYSCACCTINRLLSKNGVDTSSQAKYILKLGKVFCNQCDTVKLLHDFHKERKTKLGYTRVCKVCRSIQKKAYDVNNIEKNKLYRRNNRKRSNAYFFNRRRTNTSYRIVCTLRIRICDVLNGRNKSASTLSLLGCSLNEFKVHLQRTAISNEYHDFDINNYSGKEYHIDHIRPCSSFDLAKPKEQRKCFHYSNLQILTATANLSKGDQCA